MTALAVPPVGWYRFDHEFALRQWSGDRWFGPVRRDADAVSTIRPRHPGRVWLISWLIAALLLIGTVVAEAGIRWNLAIFVAAGGGAACTGPVVSVLMVLHWRLALKSRLTWPTVVGLMSGLIACLLSPVLEIWLPGLLAAAMAGPAEEVTKLLVPVLLLAFGPVAFRNPRIGVWMVAVSAGTFGVLEGTVYVLSVWKSSAHMITDAAAAGTSPNFVLTLGSRPYIEVSHVFYTVGAAAIIWLTARRGKSVITLIAIAAIAAAAVLHSFNDIVLADLLPTALTPTLHGLASIVGLVVEAVWIVLVYTLWFRPLVRLTTPPEAIAEAPRRWLPRARSAEAADPQATAAAQA